MRKIAVGLLLGLGGIAVFGQSADAVAGVAEKMGLLNAQLRRGGQEWRIREVLVERAGLMRELIREHPQQAVRLAITGREAEGLGGVGADLLEREGTWHGSITVGFEEDVTAGRQRLRRFLQTPQGRIELAFAGEGPMRALLNADISGIRLGDSMAVTALTTHRDATSGDVEEACSFTGPQNTAVILLNLPGYRLPPQYTPAYMEQQIFSNVPGLQSLNRFLMESSHGLTSVTGRVFGPILMNQNYGCDEEGWDATLRAIESSVDFSEYRRLIFVRPSYGCSGGGFGEVGCSLQSAGTRGQRVMSTSHTFVGPNETGSRLSTMVHEFGHNLGLYHASTEDFGTEPLGPIGSAGAKVIYGDPYDVMGSGTGQFSAQHKAVDLGWLRYGEGYQEVRTSGSYRLTPFESSTGLRALRILRDGASGSWLWAEFRQPIGDFDSKLASVHPGVFNGALIRHEQTNPGANGTWANNPFLLDFHPVAAPNNFNDAALGRGQAWTDAYSPLRLAVTSADATGLTIEVNYDQQCATGILSAGSFGAGGGTGSITVQASSSCAWTLTPQAWWITLMGARSGEGNGTVNFAVAPNTLAGQRSAHVTLQRQGLRVTQEGSGLHIVSVSPSNGEGSHGEFTFRIAPSSPAPSSLWVSFGEAAVHRCVIQLAGVPLSAAWLWTATSGSSADRTGPVILNAPGTTLDNGYCSLSPARSFVSVNGGQVIVTLQIAFAPKFAGTHRISAWASNISGINTEAIALGTWMVPSGLRFVPLAPCRLMETRSAYNFEGRTGGFGPPFLSGGEMRALTMANSNVCQIPATARAYVLNVTLIPRNSVDFVTLWPGNEVRPSVWSIRSPDGQIVANQAIVKSGDGVVNLYASHDADVLIDISGYFAEAAATGTNLVYYPLSPCRVVETRAVYRSPSGPFGPPSMNARETRRFRFPVTPYCSVPAGASAYSVTLTAIPPQPLPFMTLWPAGGAQPNVSSINSFAGRVLANNVIVPASADGSIDVFALERTDFLIDINGYFAADNGQGLYYFPVTQCRASDSTVSGGIYPDDSTRTIAIPSAGNCVAVPAGAKGYAVNVTALPSGSPLPFLTVYPSGQLRPNASILNAFEGQTVTNSAIIPAGTSGAIDVYAFRRTNVVVELSGYFGR